MTIRLTYQGPGYNAHLFPDLDAEVVRASPSRVVLRHRKLGPRDVAFSRSYGFPVGTEAQRGIGRSGYKLPREEMK